MNESDTSRLMELLMDRASQGLSRSEELELDLLLAADPTTDDLGLELAAGAIDLAFEGEIEAMPAELRGTIARQAELYFRGAGAPAATRSRPATTSAPKTVPFPEARTRASRWSANLGWLAAAAALAFALLKPGGPGNPAVDVRPVSGTELRAQLLAEDPATLRLPWTATEDASATGAAGEVIWSADRQQGVMHIEGLAANDPGQLQYQLWIFDKERDERYPVDGGVFDVPAGAAAVDVPILATLPVNEPVLFAITVEKPGGVMVSSRERIVLVAQPS